MNTNPFTAPEFRTFKEQACNIFKQVGGMSQTTWCSSTVNDCIYATVAGISVSKLNELWQTPSFRQIDPIIIIPTMVEKELKLFQDKFLPFQVMTLWSQAQTLSLIQRKPDDRMSRELIVNNQLTVRKSTEYSQVAALLMLPIVVLGRKIPFRLVRGYDARDLFLHYWPHYPELDLSVNRLRNN